MDTVHGLVVPTSRSSVGLAMELRATISVASTIVHGHIYMPKALMKILTA